MKLFTERFQFVSILIKLDTNDFIALTSPTNINKTFTTNLSADRGKRF
jgi:hypothetical protein